MKLDICIRNGTIVTASGRADCDLGIRDGRIVAIGMDLPAADQDIDATGLFVMPGGVDAHCHIEEPPFNGAELADDFQSATRSAACGGTTTIVPFVNRLKGATLRQSVEEYSDRAARRSIIDYAFHIILDSGSKDAIGQELPALMLDGFLSVKVFMNYDGYMLDDRHILEVMETTRQHGGITMVHAENGHCAHWLADRLEMSGKTEIVHFRDASPTAIEREATHRAITFSQLTGAPTMLVHVSSSEAVEQVRWAHARGIPILAESCPQYLMETCEALNQPGWQAAGYICSPPLRTRADTEDIWRSVCDGTIHIVSSDHCPYSLNGAKGKRSGASRPHFRHVPPGLPGLETRLMLLFSDGVSAGRITAEQFVLLTSTKPAQIYGLYPRKGGLMPGADADVVLWDPNAQMTLSHANLHDRCDYTPYEGRMIKGLPVMTLSRGVCLWDHGKVFGESGRGTFVKRRAHGSGLA